MKVPFGDLPSAIERLQRETARELRGVAVRTATVSAASAGISVGVLSLLSETRVSIGIAALTATSGAVISAAAVAWLVVRSAHKWARHAAIQELKARRADARCRDAEERYRLLAEHTTDFVAAFELNGNPLYVSPSHERLMERALPAEPSAAPRCGLLDSTSEAVRSAFRSTLEQGSLRRDFSLQCGDERVIVDMSLSLIDTPQGKRILAIGRDVTKQRQLTKCLQQTQKMDAVGRLAGGIAHDFNNLLSLIGAAAALALEQLPEHHPAAREVNDVLRGVGRGNALTNKLMAVSRRQVPNAERPACVQSTLASLGRLLTRVLPTNIHLTIECDNSCELVTASESDLEQILLNLALNARDAMADGGRLTIRAESRQLSRGMVALPVGRYVMISASDTGTGISAEVRRHLFEPFFTTKPPGKGTGLGLATSHGIATQNGGTLLAESTEGCGTTFTLWLPVASPDSVRSWEAAPRVTMQSKRGLSVLLIEDDPLVFASTTRMLTSLGHLVKGAATLSQAIQLHEQGLHPDVLVTDLMLVDGLSYATVDYFMAIQPELRVVFVSGYAEDSARLAQYINRGARLLAKPFTRQAMANALAEPPAHALGSVSPQS
ncbi:MAG: ATP-binding protein [Myxococcales bacterium]